MSNKVPVQRIAAKAVIEAEDGILALKPSAIDANRKWHIPGGIRDDIMEPIGQTAVREVLEETGIDISNVPGRVFKVGEWPAVDKGETVRILAVFFHYKLPERPEIKLSHEHEEAAWLTHENYSEFNTNPEVDEIVEELLRSISAMNIVVKLSVTNDIPHLVNVLNDALKKKKEHDDDAWGNDEFTENEITKSVSRRQRYSVFQDKELIGTFVLLETDEKVWGQTNDSALYLHNFATNESVSGRGIGREMLKWIESEAYTREKNFVRFDVPAKNRKLNQYYRDCGYSVVTTKNIFESGASNLYEKKITDS